MHTIKHEMRRKNIQYHWYPRYSLVYKFVKSYNAILHLKELQDWTPILVERRKNELQKLYLKLLMQNWKQMSHTCPSRNSWSDVVERPKKSFQNPSKRSPKCRKFKPWHKSHSKHDKTTFKWSIPSKTSQRQLTHHSHVGQSSPNAWHKSL